MTEHRDWDPVRDVVQRTFENLSSRISRGFQGLSQQIEKDRETKHGATPLTGPVQESLTRVFRQQEAALQQTIETSLPDELARTLKVLRWSLRALVGIALLTALLLSGLWWYGQHALLDRTPTAAQIQLMLQGWQQEQTKEGPP